MRVRVSDNSFKSGEIKPTLRSSDQLDVVTNGLAKALNSLPLPEGGICERAGTTHVAKALSASEEEVLYTFERASNDVACLALGRVRARVIDRDTFQVLAEFDHGLPADKRDNRWPLQIGDTLTLWDQTGETPPKCYTRNENGSWSVQDFEFVNGPFYELDDRNIQLSITGTSGLITVTASQAIFNPGHVGGQIRFFHVSGGAPFEAWQPDVRVQAPTGLYRYNNGRVYVNRGIDPAAVQDSVTGTNPPVHDNGIVSDGRLLWEFVDDGAGYGVITNYTSPTRVTVQVKENLPQMSQTRYWAFGGYCSEFGYPTGAVLWEERIWPFAAPRDVIEVNASQTKKFTGVQATFKPGLGTGLQVKTDAIRRRVAGGSQHPIVAMMAHGTLILFTTRNEFRMAGSADFQAITPTETGVRERGARGAAPLVRPVKTEAALLFAARGARDVRALDVREGGYSVSVSVASSHLFDAPVVEMAEMAEPDRVVLLRLANGKLLAHVFDPENDVRGWSPWETGGRVVSMTDMPGGSGVFDAVWICIERDGEYSIEQVNRRFRVEWDEPSAAIQVDAAAYFDVWNTDPSRVVALPQGAEEGDFIEVTAASISISAGDVGRVYLFKGLQSDPNKVPYIAKAEMTAFVSGRAAMRLLTPVPEDFAPTWQWAKGVTDLSGLDWLSGSSVQGLVDGASFEGVVAADGSLGLGDAYGRVVIGLPFDWICETLPPELGSEIGAGKYSRLKIQEATFDLEASDVISVYDPDIPEERRTEEALRYNQEGLVLVQAPSLRSGPASLSVSGNWGPRGRLAWRKRSPHPGLVLGLQSTVEVNAS